MQTAITYLDSNPIIFPPTNMTAIYVEVVGLDVIISLMIMCSVLLAIIAFYTMRRNIRI